jgi:hypothetical protein
MFINNINMEFNDDELQGILDILQPSYLMETVINYVIHDKLEVIEIGKKIMKVLNDIDKNKKNNKNINKNITLLRDLLSIYNPYQIEYHLDSIDEELDNVLPDDLPINIENMLEEVSKKASDIKKAINSQKNKIINKIILVYDILRIYKICESQTNCINREIKYH